MMSLAALAGLLGATGVGLAAVAAHVSGEPTLKTAADFLLFHAAALLAITASLRGKPHRGLLVAGSIIGFGTILFSGDLAVRALAGVHLFPMAAPSGGLLLIAGWLLCAAAAPFALRDER